MKRKAKNIKLVVDRPHASRAGSVGGVWWSGSGEKNKFEIVSSSIFELASYSKVPTLASFQLLDKAVYINLLHIHYPSSL